MFLMNYFQPCMLNHAQSDIHVCIYIPERKFPVVLPHNLLPWLQRNHAFPQVTSAELSTYWKHFSDNNVEWATASEGIQSQLHPCFLWGDDVQYNESYEKLCVVCLGHCLDKRKFSLETCWPLFTIREAL